VVKDSELVEQGTHEELLAAGGTYAELYKIQTSQGAEHEHPAVEHAAEKPVA
jgi:ABC-type transport system involved in cytochrome bd biosynthesis fused ATPase/permease subunit